MTLSEAIINRIHEICDERKITENMLSTICGITQSTLNSITLNRNSQPRVSTIKKICDGVNITLSEFFDREYFDSLEQEIK